MVISQRVLLISIFLVHYAYFSAGCTIWRHQKHTTKSIGWEAGIVRSLRLRLPWRKSIYRIRKRAILQKHLAQKYTSEIRSPSNIIYSISTIQPPSDTLTLKEAFIKIGTPAALQQRFKFRVLNKRSKLCRLFKLYHTSLLHWPTPNVDVLHKNFDSLHFAENYTTRELGSAPFAMKASTC